MKVVILFYIHKCTAFVQCAHRVSIRVLQDSLSPSKRNMPPHLVAALNASQNATLGPAGLSRQPDDDLVDVDNIDDDNGVYLLSDQNRYVFPLFDFDLRRKSFLLDDTASLTS